MRGKTVEQLRQMNAAQEQTILRLNCNLARARRKAKHLEKLLHREQGRKPTEAEIQAAIFGEDHG